MAAAFSLGAFGDERLERGGRILCEMVAQQTACLRRLASGERGEIVGFNRFFGNRRVTVERLVEGWNAEPQAACAGRHVLAIQARWRSISARRKGVGGLGEIGKGSGRGLLLHAMLGVDAESGGLLELVTGKIWTRDGRVKTLHAKRSLADKESVRWLETAQAARPLLARRPW